MSKTELRQNTQIRNSDTYDDTIAAGATMETVPTEIETDLNAARSQIKRLLWADAAGNWYDDIQTYNSKKRGVNEVSEDLDVVETKVFLFPTPVFTTITVPLNQSFVILSVAGSETPAETAAVGAVATEGVVVAYNSSFGTATLDEVVGSNAISPQNLCLLQKMPNYSTVLSSNNREIYGLLQSESNVDGHTFDDATNRVQLTFVEVNAAGNDLEIVDPADIEGDSFRYQYVRRLEYLNLPQDAFLFRTSKPRTEPSLLDVLVNASGDILTNAAGEILLKG